MPPFCLLVLDQVPIFEQLKLEETLLRVDHRNWLILNQGVSPAIVMGISGKKEQLIQQETLMKASLPIIRRFSGGGTVVVDEQTFFCSLIGNKSLFDFPCYPESLLKWTEKLYAGVFESLPFSLKGQDYAFLDRKFGGNAQYITKERWLHHSSLLWDYNETLMDHLLIPPKMPEYRQARKHTDFLCCLKDYFPSMDIFKQNLLENFQQHFEVVSLSLNSIRPQLQLPCRHSTRFENNCAS